MKYLEIILVKNCFKCMKIIQEETVVKKYLEWLETI
jgi:hypothetical protein